MEDKKLKVLIVSSEVAPYAKSGGLGDVAGSLPKALKELGVDVRVVLPKYKTIKNEHFEDVKYLGSFDTNLSWRTQKAGILLKEADVPVYFIENDYYFYRDGLYGYGDDNERFAFFCKATLDMLSFIDFYPDVIHCNDWQTGPLCLLLKETYRKLIYYSKIKTLYTIHNLQYQGVFGRETMDLLDVPDYCFTNGDLEFYGNVSYMKAGLIYADKISTVSETYAKEIQTEQYGYGMDGILRFKKDNLCGIINGIDFNENNPATDTRLYKNFDINSIEIKKENKRELQKELGLEERDVPIISIISRLADQKGIDLVAQIFDELMHEDVQFVVLGTGESRYEHMFKSFEYRYKGKVCSNIMFDATRAQRIYASSDIFLMPSLFEPCGLGQMFSLRYGTVPVVRKTGGLADTIFHYNTETKEGNGFVFETYDSNGLLWAIKEALKVYNMGEEEWSHVVKNAMSCNYSWENSARKYVELYKSL